MTAPASTLTLDSLALDENDWAATPVEHHPPADDLQRQWVTDGYVVLPGLIPDPLIDAYAERWQQVNGNGGEADWRPGGWPDATPYMHEPTLLDLCSHKGLHDTMAHLIGEPVGLHLNLTGWQTTERDWHQDGYLNEPYVGGHYVAAWVALDRIHPDSGPFQLVPGSTAWPQVSQARIRDALRAHGYDGDGPGWPKATEAILTPLFEQEIRERGIEPVTFLPERGDVILWNGRALHRGSRARRHGMERRAVIAHFSGIEHRPDMPPAVEHGDGWYFPLHGGPVR